MSDDVPSTVTGRIKPTFDGQDKSIYVQQWDKESSELLEFELMDRGLVVHAPGSVMAQCLYEDDLEEIQTTLKLFCTRGVNESKISISYLTISLLEASRTYFWLKTCNLGMPKEDMEKAVKKYEDYNDLSYKFRQQALISKFTEEFDANVKLWKSGRSTSDIIWGRLNLSKNKSHSKPELEYPESHFTVIKKPPRVHYRDKRGPVDMDEVPGKTLLLLELFNPNSLLRLPSTKTLAKIQDYGVSELKWGH